ncbi:hypothetical protein SteCoe_20065 [Stentor coeruleus]|uniref:Uncharacterized protein n=1 Tax=Stentor coeruleus TaxID=5963 RepID=A0A1R2BSU3_9CILI|nr:hypothetical protein SteCoe_20065 [Stentor coeruleus]
MNQKRIIRTLRSKVAKIMSSMPNSCTKHKQKESYAKWTENKKRFYEVNEILESKGLKPLSKLNLSSESEIHDSPNISPRTALMKNLSEDELVLLSEDPMYYMHDKKFLKGIVTSNWEELIKNDPKDPENIKKGLQHRTNIDFLTENTQNKPRVNKKPKLWGTFKTQTGSTPLITKSSKKHTSYLNSPIKLKTYQKHYMSSKHSPSTGEILYFSSENTINNLPKLPQAKNKPSTKPKTLSRAISQDLEPLKEFLKVSSKIENLYKDSLIKTAQESKLSWVKNYLGKWERKTKL